MGISRTEVNAAGDGKHASNGHAGCRSIVRGARAVEAEPGEGRRMCCARGEDGRPSQAKDREAEA